MDLLEIVLHKPNEVLTSVIKNSMFSAPQSYVCASNGKLYVKDRAVFGAVVAVKCRQFFGRPTIAPAIHINDIAKTVNAKAILLYGDQTRHMLKQEIQKISDITVLETNTDSSFSFSGFHMFANNTESVYLRASGFEVYKQQAIPLPLYKIDKIINTVKPKIFFSSAHMMYYFILHSLDATKYILFDNTDSIRRKAALCKNSSINAIVYDYNTAKMICG